MTEAEQWAEINYVTFFDAVCNRISAAEQSLETAQVSAVSPNWLETNVNQVPIYWRMVGDDCIIKIGEKQNSEPFYTIQMPKVWLGS